MAPGNYWHSSQDGWWEKGARKRKQKEWKCENCSATLAHGGGFCSLCGAKKGRRAMDGSTKHASTTPPAPGRSGGTPATVAALPAPTSGASGPAAEPPIGERINAIRKELVTLRAFDAGPSRDAFITEREAALEALISKRDAARPQAATLQRLGGQLSKQQKVYEKLNADVESLESKLAGLQDELDAKRKDAGEAKAKLEELRASLAAAPTLPTVPTFNLEKPEELVREAAGDLLAAASPEKVAAFIGKLVEGIKTAVAQSTPTPPEPPAADGDDDVDMDAVRTKVDADITKLNLPDAAKRAILASVTEHAAKRSRK